MNGATSQKIQSTILCALAEQGQGATAATAGISETRLSRWKSDGGLSLEEVTKVLAALGFRLVHAGDSDVTLPATRYHALLELARSFTDGELRTS